MKDSHFKKTRDLITYLSNIIIYVNILG